MASRPAGYGLTAEVQNRIAGKYDPELEREARQWIEAVTGDRIDEGVDNFHESLKDGIVLCRLINTIKPNSVKKVNESKMAFKQMENIGNFLEACSSIGIQKSDLFQTVDLYEKTNMAQVVNAIFALGRKAQAIGFQGPVLGARESQSNVREFTEEQIKAGAGVIGLQMGSNKGASQAGQNFGKTRAIVD